MCKLQSFWKSDQKPTVESREEVDGQERVSGGVLFGGEQDDEHRFSGMMWADNHCPFSDDKDKLTLMVSDIIEELMDLNMEARLGSLWWTTSTHKDDEERTLTVGRQRERLGCAVR